MDRHAWHLEQHLRWRTHERRAGQLEHEEYRRKDELAKYSRSARLPATPLQMPIGVNVDT